MSNQFSVKLVDITFLTHTIKDVPKETFLKISFNSDMTSYTGSAYGKGVTSLLNDNSGTIELTTNKNSDTDIVLTALLEAQKHTGKLVEGPLLVNDKSGGALYAIPEAHIHKATDIGYAEDAGSIQNVWTFHADDIQPLVSPSGLKDVERLAKVASAVASSLALAAAT